MLSFIYFLCVENLSELAFNGDFTILSYACFARYLVNDAILTSCLLMSWSMKAWSSSWILWFHALDQQCSIDSRLPAETDLLSHVRLLIWERLVVEESKLLNLAALGLLPAEIVKYNNYLRIWWMAHEKKNRWLFPCASGCAVVILPPLLTWTSDIGLVRAHLTYSWEW